jgi:hypothetical protein
LERRLEADALVVDEPRGQVRAPGREAVDLSTRVPVRRVLLRLAELRETSPGVALPSASLLEAGWPGEAFSPDAGANRLQVALSTLRKWASRITSSVARTGISSIPRSLSACAGTGHETRLDELRSARRPGI